MPSASGPRRANLFGSRVRDRLLVLLALDQNVHLRGAARMLDVSPSELASAVMALERIGVVASQLVGSTRILALNSRWYAAAELRTLLERMGEADEEIGKPL